MLAVSAVGLDDRYALEKEEVAGELAELLCSILSDPALRTASSVRRISIRRSAS